MQFLYNSRDLQRITFGIIQSLDFVHCLVFKIKLYLKCGTGDKVQRLNDSKM
jgi:hypothetical protein